MAARFLPQLQTKKSPILRTLLFAVYLLFEVMISCGQQSISKVFYYTKCQSLPFKEIAGLFQLGSKFIEIGDTQFFALCN